MLELVLLQEKVVHVVGQAVRVHRAQHLLGLLAAGAPACDSFFATDDPFVVHDNQNLRTVIFDAVQLVKNARQEVEISIATDVCIAPRPLRRHDQVALHLRQHLRPSPALLGLFGFGLRPRP